MAVTSSGLGLPKSPSKSKMTTTGSFGCGSVIFSPSQKGGAFYKHFERGFASRGR
jgi:hypothetical protein